MNKTICMPIGISGSGKSTLIRNAFPEMVVVEPDAIRRELTGDVSDQTRNREVWELVHKRLRETLDLYGKVVLDGINTTSKSRAQTLKLFPDARKLAIVFDVDPEVAKARVQKDINEGVDRSAVPADVIDRQYQSLVNGYANIEAQFDEVIYIGRHSQPPAKGALSLMN